MGDGGHLPEPASRGQRPVIFEWLPAERFLVERWEIPVPEAPDGIYRKV